MMSKTVFITGVTGYVGGATLARLLGTPSTKSFQYSALVRNKDKAGLLGTFGVHPVIASLGDAAALTSEAEKADIVIHTADSSDNVPAVQALLSGMKKGGKNPIYIHISGTGVFIDDARGEYKSDEVYTDLDPAHINSVADDALHRPVDLTVIEAASYARAHVVLPPTIYGIADHALVKAGIANPLSLQIPGLIRAGIERGQGPAIGKGLNVWSDVHIDDITGAIVTVLEAAMAGKTVIGREGYYIAETGEYTMNDVCVEIARGLSSHGIGTPEPTPFTEAEYDKYHGGSHFMGTNARARGERTRQLGWSPTHTADDFLKNIALEVEYVLKTERRQL